MYITAQSQPGDCPYTFFCLQNWCPGSDSNRHIFLRQNLNLVRLPISPPGLAYHNNTQRLLCQLIWRKTEESNPIPVKRTWFSRPVAAPTPLHHLPKLVSVAGIEPTLERPKRSVIPFHHTESVL